jgi:phosphatidylglycerol:prolipoprotein diacylglycerol transferase
MYPVLFHLGPFTFYSFGLMAALALIVPGYFVWRLLRARGVPGEFAYELIFAAGIGGFAGARIYWIVQHWSEASKDLLNFLVGGFGLTWYGGLIGGFIAVVFWTLVRKQKVGLVANAMGPAVALGYAIGRVGCQLSGDGDYGKPTTSFLGMAYPHGTVPTPPGVKVWPTPIFEIVLMVAVFWVLYRMAKRPQPGWYVFGWFLVLAGIERFLIEFLRRNPVWLFGLTAPQILSVVSVAIGVGIIVVQRHKPPVEAHLGKERLGPKPRTERGAAKRVGAGAQG